MLRIARSCILKQTLSLTALFQFGSNCCKDVRQPRKHPVPLFTKSGNFYFVTSGYFSHSSCTFAFLPRIVLLSPSFIIIILSFARFVLSHIHTCTHSFLPRPPLLPLVFKLSLVCVCLYSSIYLFT